MMSKCGLFVRMLATTSSTPIEVLRSRLLYQSKKRGILENDILIGGFAEQNLHKLTEEELTKYDEMINGEHMEWDLYYYLTGKKEAPLDLNLNPAFAKMREYVKSRKSSN